VEDVSYLAALVAGILSFVSPCVLPLVPGYLSFISGVSLDNAHTGTALPEGTTRRVFLASVAFVLGFTCVFVALGASASTIGALINEKLWILTKIAGVAVILFGLHTMGLLKINALYRQAQIDVKRKPAGPMGAFVVGLAFAFGWTPCIGPVLATVLTLAANEGSLGAGVRLLFVYSLGLGVPFILAAAAIGPFIAFLQRFRKHLRHVEMVMGVLLVLTGVLMLTGSLNWFGQWLIDNVPVLARIEEMLTPQRLQTEILKEGGTR